MLFIWFFFIVFALWTWKLNQHKIPGMEYEICMQIPNNTKQYSFKIIPIISSSFRSNIISILGIAYHYDIV